VVRPDAEFREAGRVQALSNELKKIDGVDIVQLDTEWVSRFNAILDVIRRGVFLAAVLFALGILVIIGNTIRLDIENRRGEIEVTKLVGGSDAFVRRPFLYNGVWYGLAGGLIAGLIVSTVVAVLSAPVQRIAGLYGSKFELQGVGLSGWVALLLGGALLGWLGSFIVATRELREIEPK
jgi:cell division transport system permease protein